MPLVLLTLVDFLREKKLTHAPVIESRWVPVSKQLLVRQDLQDTSLHGSAKNSLKAAKNE